MNYASAQTITPPPAPSASGASGTEDLMRIFNSALVASRVEAARDFSAEIYALVESPAYKTVLSSVRQLARAQNVSEREAAEAVIRTFRKLDQLWGDYILQEGVDRLKGQGT